MGFFGGQVENDESHVQAAYRELKEKIGYMSSEIVLLDEAINKEKLSDNEVLIHQSILVN